MCAFLCNVRPTTPIIHSLNIYFFFLSFLLLLLSFYICKFNHSVSCNQANPIEIFMLMQTKYLLSNNEIWSGRYFCWQFFYFLFFVCNFIPQLVQEAQRLFARFALMWTHIARHIAHNVSCVMYNTVDEGMNGRSPQECVVCMFICVI